jgi:outer membrane protein TolC
MKIARGNGRWGRWICAGLVSMAGCAPASRFRAWQDQKDTSYFANYASRIEYPDVQTRHCPEVEHAPLPLVIQNPSELPTWDLSLQEAIHLALQNSTVLRSLGGSVVQSAQGTGTVLDPALALANPQTGVEAALSAFDAQLATQLFWQKNNRPNNTAFLALFPVAIQQTTGNYISELSKRTAQGASFALRHNVTYDNNNSPQRLFRSDFTGWVEAEWRQPLLRGAGTTYNRIAGPSGSIGVYNGVLIARINSDISLADFEQGVIGLLNDVESAYWDLLFAYYDLEAKVAGRESALRTWQRVNKLQEAEARGGEADAEAQARSQYYLFESQVNDALAGPLGLYAREQRLRYMMGLGPTDGRLIKPVDQPILAEVIVDWELALTDALNHRVEVRRQKWNIKRRELELVAARLNRRPRLDTLTQYRWRGLGDHLIGDRDPNNSFESIYQNILEGDYQEWQAGFELSTPVGMRQASAAVKHAQLNLAREISVLCEQELRISHDLSNAARQMSRSFTQVQTNFNRVEANKLQVEVLRRRYEEGLININFLLDAQQQLANSQSSYYQTLVDYAQSMRDFHRQKGSLLSFNQVQLSEAGWPAPAYGDAYQRGRFFTPRDEAPQTPAPISQGAYNPSTVGM